MRLLGYMKMEGSFGETKREKKQAKFRKENKKVKPKKMKNVL